MALPITYRERCASPTTAHPDYPDLRPSRTPPPRQEAAPNGGSRALLASPRVVPVLVRLAGVRPGGNVPVRSVPTGRLRRRSRRRCRWRAGPARCGPDLAHRGARFSVGSGFLDIPQRGSSIQGGRLTCACGPCCFPDVRIGIMGPRPFRDAAARRDRPGTSRPEPAAPPQTPRESDVRARDHSQCSRSPVS